MQMTRQRLRSFGRLGLILCDVVVALVLVGVAGLIYLERGWVTPRMRELGDAFRNGSIGTEVMPLPVALVLPSLAPQHFQPAGPDSGDWIEQFGFLHNPDSPYGLPIGFMVSNFRPKTAAPSPVPFVGFACAMCHTTGIQTSDSEEPRPVEGPGSVSLNIFAWVDALSAALIEREPPPDGQMVDRDHPRPYKLTADQMIAAYEEQSGANLSMSERLMVRLWLEQIRKRIEESIPRYGEPYGGSLSRDETVTPTGPTRTQPFRVLIRELVHRPGTDMRVYSKMATVFWEGRRPRAQFDGSIADINSRSAFAALAQGATAVNLANPEIANNIREASAYTATLGAPAFTELFPSQSYADTATLAHGREVYKAHCFGCHGDKAEGGAWDDGPRTHSVIPLSEIGTDPERVTFRYYGELAGLVHAYFGTKHPFSFAREDIFPHPGDENNMAARGYLASPIDGVYLRAPYLHNASVLTLAELINLEPRRDVFYRGRNLYDTRRVGFASPSKADGRRYFRYDTATVGNANTGHSYPWDYDDPARSEDDLRALLEYLKTL